MDHFEPLYFNDIDTYTPSNTTPVLQKLINNTYLVEYMNTKYPDQENVRRLVEGYNPQRIMETLPTSEYTAYSENKGEFF